MSDYAQIEKRYNADEFLKFTETETQRPGNENNRYELIDGVIYMMASPSLTHYNVCKFIEKAFEKYFESKGCSIYNGSVNLFLFDKKRFALFSLSKSKCENVVIPDLMVVCNKTQIKNRGIFGAPDLVVEVVSESNSSNDYVRKLNAYLAFGVKEYWIVNPIKRIIRIYDMTVADDNLAEYNYTFNDTVYSELFKSLCIDFKQFTGFVEG